MKKIVLVFMTGLLIASCGRDKKKESEAVETAKSNKYSIVVDAIYEKDDSLVVYHKLNNYYIYDKPTVVKVKGSPQMQRITFLIADGVAAENFSFVTSTNKEQKYLTVKNITIKNNDSVVVDGDNFKFSNFWLADESFVWDPKLLRSNLNHGNKYPPAFVGNDMIGAALKK